MLQQVLAHGGNTFPPLFRGAILSSLCLPPEYAPDAPIPQALYNQVVSRLKSVESAVYPLNSDALLFL